jgi:type IV pilus assembly protein PilB
LPTIYGEKMVLRLLAKEAILMHLTDMGFTQEALERFQGSFGKPYGAILVTGPTGSGKTTTLYAALNALNDPEKNLITVEDPVEYRLAGMGQVQVNLRAGLTFAAALRSILRQDPDIVMIGEIRDEETAMIAIESALTGHLVLSTLHTNDAGSSLTRLNEMGIEPFLVSSAVDCVVAQRLARRLCPHCREAYSPTQKALDDIKFLAKAAEIEQIYRARGCKKCNNTGYKGRVGLYEVLVVSEQIEKLVVAGATADHINNQARKEGMKTLREDGFIKVLSGQTSIEEIMRVTT